MLSGLSGSRRPPSNPLVVLLPGILGSKLTDVQTGNVFWGSSFNDPMLAFDPRRKTRADILSEAELSLLKVKFRFSVYKEALAEITSQRYLGYDPLLPFAYDWRQSNRKSAKDFFDFICGRRAYLSDKSIIFVAHSMGGLVLKEFFRSYYDTDALCPDQSSLRSFLKIDEIMFVGTPHLGAPKALSSIADQFALAGLKPVDRYVAAGLNNYGIWFESPYELLPIEASRRCAFTGKRNDIVSVQTDTGKHTDIDIFSANTWKRLGMPLHRDLQGEEAKYYTFLETRLREAEAFLCDLATYEFDPALAPRVDYFVGRHDQMDTPSHVTLDVSSEAKLRKIDSEQDFGDGTVPEDEVALRDPRQVRTCLAKDHAHLLEDPTVVTYLVRLFRKYQYAWIQDLSADPTKFTEVKAAFSEQGYFMPVSFSDFAFVAGGIQLASSVPAAVEELNTSVIAAADIGSGDIYQLARNAPSPALRSSYYELALAVPGSTPERTGWVINNLGHLALQNRNAEAASTVYGLALTGLEDDRVANAWREAGVLGKLYGNIAATKFAVGDYTSAEAFAGQGAALGNLNAAQMLSTIRSAN